MDRNFQLSKGSLIPEAGKENLFGEKKHEIIYFMFRDKFFHKNTVRMSGAPSLLQKEKRDSARSDVSKVLFPDIGKITTQSRESKVWGGKVVFYTNFKRITLS